MSGDIIQPQPPSPQWAKTVTVTLTATSMEAVRRRKREDGKWSFSRWISDEWRTWRAAGMPPYEHTTARGRSLKNFRVPGDVWEDMHSVFGLNVSVWVDYTIRTRLGGEW